jgi:hypothetical protein
MHSEHVSAAVANTQRSGSTGRSTPVSSGS